MKKNKPEPKHPLEAKLDRVGNLLEQLLAVQMYRGGAGQREIADNFGMALGKVNRLVKGVKAPKDNHGKE